MTSGKAKPLPEMIVVTPSRLKRGRDLLARIRRVADNTDERTRKPTSIRVTNHEYLALAAALDATVVKGVGDAVGAGLTSIPRGRIAVPRVLMIDRIRITCRALGEKP